MQIGQTWVSDMLELTVCNQHYRYDFKTALENNKD